MSSELEAFVSEDSELDTTVDEIAESQEGEVSEAANVESVASQPDDETGEIAETPSAKPQTEAPSEPQLSEAERGLLAAKQAEKDRRIRAEQELQALRQAQQEQNKPDPYLEPDRAIQHEVQKVRNEMMGMFRNMSEANARKNHDDYDSKFEVFTNLVQNQPILLAQLANELDPGEFVYQTAKRHLEMQEVGDLSSYKERLRAELKAELMNEFKGQMPNVPPDLTKARSTGGDPTETIADGDDGLEQLLGR